VRISNRESKIEETFSHHRASRRVHSGVIIAASQTPYDCTMEAKRCLVLHGAAHDSSTAAEGEIFVFSDGSSSVQEKLDSIAKEGLVDEVKCVSG
jgi:hypothetical protein